MSIIFKPSSLFYSLSKKSIIRNKSMFQNIYKYKPVITPDIHIANLPFIISTPSSSWYPEKQDEEKICKNCKYFVKDLYYSDHYGRCSRFPFVSDNIKIIYLVIGKSREPYTYFKYCNEIRMDERLCGQEGINYEKSTDL